MSAANAVRAAVQTGPLAYEVRQFPRPRIGDDDGLLRIEACGVCGSDVEQYRGHLDRAVEELQALLQHAAPAEDGRIVDEDVDPPPALEHLVARGLELRNVEDVRGEGLGV